MVAPERENPRNGRHSPCTAPILAARAVLTEEGHVLLLWLHVERDDMELEIDAEDDEDDDEDEDDNDDEYDTP